MGLTLPRSVGKSYVGEEMLTLSSVGWTSGGELTVTLEGSLRDPPSSGQDSPSFAGTMNPPR